MSIPQDRQRLITRLEQFSRKHPRAYRLRVMLVAALGYAYLFFIVALPLSVVAWVVRLMVRAGSFHPLILLYLLIPVVFVAMVLRSMWITVPAPEGEEIFQEQAPELFDLIIEVQRALASRLM